MNRRDSLKGMGGLSLAGMTGFTLPALAAKKTTVSMMLRGTSDGKVVESVDGGKSWHVVAKFGSHCSVDSINRGGDRIYARISVKGHPFLLESRDARTWVTA